MMLHRHFEDDKKRQENMTKLKDVTPKEFVSDVFPPEEEEVSPPEEEVEEAPKRRGRPKKSEE